MSAIRGRPVLMQRFPNGVDGSNFFQKRVPKDAPEWLETTVVSTPNGTTSQALVAADLAHIVWAVNLGCLGFHVWPNHARRRRPRRRAAHRPRPAARRRLRRGPRRGTRGEGAARRAGRRGLAQDHGQPRHPRVHAPRAAVDPIEVRRAAVAVARELARRRPDAITDAWWKEERGERVFVDFNQNAPHKTVFGAWSVRARPAARGVDAVRLGRARRHRSRGVHDGSPCPAGSSRGATRGPTSPTTRSRSRRCSRCTTATSSRASRTRRGRPSTRRCRASRHAWRRAGPVRTTTATDHAATAEEAEVPAAWPNRGV